MTINVKVDRAQGTITWESDRTAKMAVARIAEMSSGLKERAMYHGLTARGTDAGAMGFGEWDGKGTAKRYATDDEKMQRILRVVEHLNNPETGWDWEMRKTQVDPLAGASEEQLKELIARAQRKLETIGIKPAAGDEQQA